MAVPQALGYAIQLAENIRRLHAAGKVHGMLCPSAVLLTDAGITLAPPGPDGLTAYSSPEQLQGVPAGAASDVFSFGAIVYHMLTGRAPFAGETAAALWQAILTDNPAPIGNLELDRVIANCLAKNSSARWQKMQQVSMELRLLMASMRRVGSRGHERPKGLEAALRAEIHQLECAVVARLEQHEKATVAALAANREEAIASIHAACEGFEQMRDRLGQLAARLSAGEERANRAEQISDETYREIMQAQQAFSAGLAQIREAITAQEQTIESCKASVSRTDDLVERVVEALDALQSMVLERMEAQAA